MVDMSTTSAGLAWAIPVSPDLLGQALEAYDKFVPILNTLRLCHRYGKGTEVHITKLPVEILSAIEEIVYQDVQSRNSTWLENFKHYEHRCEPSDHPEAAAFAWEAALEEGGWECGKCSDGMSPCGEPGCTGHGSGTADDCSECGARLSEMADEYLSEQYEWCYDECPVFATRWEKQISQTTNGDFVKYDELLLKHFGLAVYFAETRISTDEPQKWPQDDNHDFHYGQPLQTTTCFVTLPRQAAKPVSYGLTEGEGEGGYASICAAQSHIVEIPSLYDNGKRSKQFGRLIRMLGLQPYVHESQLHGRISTQKKSTAAAKGPDVNPGEKDVSEEDRRKAAFDKMEWPQLVMLVETNFEW